MLQFMFPSPHLSFGFVANADYFSLKKDEKCAKVSGIRSPPPRRLKLNPECTRKQTNNNNQQQQNNLVLIFPPAFDANQLVSRTPADSHSGAATLLIIISSFSERGNTESSRRLVFVSATVCR